MGVFDFVEFEFGGGLVGGDDLDGADLEELVYDGAVHLVICYAEEIDVIRFA